MTTRTLPLGLLSLATLLGTAAPAFAVQKTSNPFDWVHPWSYSRMAAAVFFVVVAVLLAFGLYFRARLNPERDVKSAPWPLNVFGETLIVSLVLATLVFLTFFAWIEDDLRQIPFRPFPMNMTWANLHSVELLVIVVCLLLCLITAFIFRHREVSGLKGR